MKIKPPRLFAITAAPVPAGPATGETLKIVYTESVHIDPSRK